MAKISLENMKRSLPLIVICISGAMIRFYNLGNIIFYWDEPFHTVELVSRSLSFVLTHDYGSMLYQLLAHFLLPLGKLEFVSRLPAALFGILTIVGTFYVGKLFFGKREGIIAALFVCFSPYMLRYSQYARGYTVFTFFSLLSLYFFYKAIEDNRTKHWTLFAVFTVINIYSILFSIVTLIVYVTFMGILFVEKFVIPKEKRLWHVNKNRLIRFTVSFLAISVILFLLLLLTRSKGTSSGIWIAETLARIKDDPTIGFFRLIHDIIEHHIHESPSVLYFLALFLIGFGIIGCLSRLRRKDALLLLYIFLPLFGFVLIKPDREFFLSAHRYFIFLLPIMFILTAKGVGHLGSIFISLIRRFGFIGKRESFFRNGVVSLFVLMFLLLEIGALIEYSDSVRRLYSLNLNKEVQSFLKEHVEEGEMLFVDAYPNKAEMLWLIPISPHRGGKRLVISFYNRDLLIQQSPQTQYGLWLVFKNSLIPDAMGAEIDTDLAGAEIRSVDGYSVVHWKSGNNTLLSNLIKTSEFLAPLHPEAEWEYRLLLAKLYLEDRNLEQALKELEILEKEGEKVSRRRSTHYSQIVQNTLVSDIRRLLFTVGNEFISEERLEEAVAAFDKCTQLSDYEFHTAIAMAYFSLGNQMLQSGRAIEGMAFVKKAIDLRSDYYFYRMILAEAYWKEGLLDRAIDEYRAALNLPSLSDEVVRRMISMPQLFAVWKEKSTWHFLWRSDEACQFSGNIYFNKKLHRFQKHHFSRKDIFNQNKDYAAEFNLSTGNRRIKTLDIVTGKKSRLTCYVKINDQLKTENIIFLNSGENPSEIPFSFPSSGKKRTGGGGF